MQDMRLQQQGQTVELLAILDLPALLPQRQPLELHWTDAQWMVLISRILGSLAGQELGLSVADFAPLEFFSLPSSAW